MFINAYLKKDNMAAYRLLLQTTDDSLFLVQQPGRVVWLREEALAEVVTMTTVDLPLSATDAELEGEFGKKADGLFALLWRRLTSQAQLASTWIMHAWIIITSTAWTSRRDRAVLEEERQRAMGESGRSGLVPSRDSFNTHKMLVMVTASGKLLGLESRSGAILWRLWAPNLDAKRGSVTGDAKDKDLTVGGWKLGGLFVQRGSAHFPHPPLASLLLQHQETGKSHLMIFNPVYGVLSSIPEPKLKRPVLQAAVLNHMGPNFTRPLLLLHDDLSVSCFPSSSSFHSLIDSMASSIFFYIVDPAHRSICGFQFLKGMKAHHIWEVAIPEGHKVLEVAGKHPGETVHSQGRVLGDRSVLYKYVNPHLVAVAMQVAENQPDKASVMLYLLDGVTGRVVYSVTLRRARSPLRLVHTENWLVVLYWNPKARRSELWILELYEGIARHNETAFSSLERPFAGPLALQQAYVLPGRAGPLQVTLTERGITSRHILVALQSGGIVSLPKAFLDPRRPEVPGEQSREEGLIPYSPELPLPTEWFINYNQTVAAVRGLHTAVTGLESTCLVCPCWKCWSSPPTSQIPLLLCPPRFPPLITFPLIQPTLPTPPFSHVHSSNPLISSEEKHFSVCSFSNYPSMCNHSLIYFILKCCFIYSSILSTPLGHCLWIGLVLNTCSSVQDV
uniref:ER membrane protein complex subunit 1 n=2 Tax=Eptatretus burgeri TaxID=7764 RepID=A0A8C4R981_EPTBU